ncbi:MAG: hypothetical protein ACM3SP_24665 [Chloroflexota bacterium]
MVARILSFPLHGILSTAVIAILVLPYSFGFNAAIVLFAGLLTPILSERKYPLANVI